MSALEDVAGSYRRLLGVPVLRALALADVCARLPQGMVAVTLLLVAATHASMATAGLVVTGYTLGQAVTGPLRGRLADRRGLAAVCAVCGVLYALALLCLLVGSLAGSLPSSPVGSSAGSPGRAPVWLLVAAATVAGLTVPPLSPGMRSLWSARAAAPLRQTAFALDAAIFDLAFIAGPVLASSLATGVAPAAAVGVLLALTGAAVVVVIIVGAQSRPGHARPGYASQDGAPARPQVPGSPATPEGGHRSTILARERRSILGALNSAALRRLLLTGALVNVALSATEVALTAYVRQHHALWASGPLLAEVSIGSIAGSLLLGARPTHVASAGTTGGPGSAGGAEGTDGIRRLARLLVWYALGLAVLAAAALRAPLVAVAAPLAGLCLGPSLATLFSLASSAVPGAAGTGETTSTGDAGGGWDTGAGGGTEAQAWLNSAMNGGAAAGAALAAATAGHPVLSLAVAVGAAGAAAGICYGKSRPRPRDHGSLRDRGPGDHAAKHSHTSNFGRSPLILCGIWFLMLSFLAMQ